MRDEREWRDEVVIHSFHVAPFSHISRFTRYARCSKRPDFSPAQPRRAETRRSAGKAAAKILRLLIPLLRGAARLSFTARINDPSKLARFSSHGMAPVLVPLRPSSEHILIVRA